MQPRFIDTPTLETERLILRMPTVADFAGWEVFMASERAQFVGGAMDAGKAWRAWGHAIGHWAMRGYGTFAVVLKDEGLAIGTAGPWYPINWPEPEIGWTLWDAKYEGRGIAFEAAFEARRYVYDVLGWETAVSYIVKGNIRSAALAERLGAVFDPDAAEPYPGEDWVYRHPAPETLA